MKPSHQCTFDIIAFHGGTFYANVCGKCGNKIKEFQLSKTTGGVK